MGHFNTLPCHIQKEPYLGPFTTLSQPHPVSIAARSTSPGRLSLIICISGVPTLNRFFINFQQRVIQFILFAVILLF